MRTEGAIKRERAIAYSLSQQVMKLGRLNIACTFLYVYELDKNIKEKLLSSQFAYQVFFFVFAFRNQDLIVQAHVEEQASQHCLSRISHWITAALDGAGWNVGWQPSHGKIDWWRNFIPNHQRFRFPGKAKIILPASISLNTTQKKWEETMLQPEFLLNLLLSIMLLAPLQHQALNPYTTRARYQLHLHLPHQYQFWTTC